MITKIKQYILAPLVIAVTLGITACEMPEEPDSYSEQGQTMNETSAEQETQPDVEPSPQWVGHMDEVKIGMSQHRVKAILGKPDDTDSTEMESFEGGTTVMD